MLPAPLRLELHPHTHPAAAAVKLSALEGPGWAARLNAHGHAPLVDFALSEPFRLLDEPTARAVRGVVRRQYDGPCHYRTARTSGSVRGCAELEAAWGERGFRRAVERLASTLAGIELAMISMPLERAHVNAQREAQSVPVDDWHDDSTPFVLVTVLTDHQADPGGALLVARPAGQEPLRLKLRRPGEAILMQGSQLRHCAQQSLTGERLTVVTSFVPAEPHLRDTTSMRVGVLFSPPGSAVTQYTRHMHSRLRRDASRALAHLATDATEVERMPLLSQWWEVMLFHAQKLQHDCGELSDALRSAGLWGSAAEQEALARLHRLAAAVNEACARSSQEEEQQLEEARHRRGWSAVAAVLVSWDDEEGSASEVTAARL